MKKSSARANLPNNLDLTNTINQQDFYIVQAKIFDFLPEENNQPPNSVMHPCANFKPENLNSSTVPESHAIKRVNY